MKSKLIALAVTGLLSALTYASEPDTLVVEYYHPELKHYFITASATDARFVDAGSAGQGWVRTGRSFGAWSTREAASADASMVHRFYSAGANSHVYVASDSDIQLLKSLEVSERASIAGTDKRFLGWGYEGEAFLAVLPKTGRCPVGTDAITRIYNHGFTNGEGSNHRYISDASLKISMEDRKWQDEGVVFCAPVNTVGGASASVSTAPSNAQAAGSYRGTVLFKAEVAGKPEVNMHSELSLTLAADGAVSGSGGGCKITGTLAAKNNAASLRSGTLTATGCTDARFNAIYSRADIEQFSTKAIDIRFRLEDNALELQIEGVLANIDITPPPAPVPVPVPSDSSALAGDFSGVLTVLIAQRPAGQAEKFVFNVNQLVTLKVSSTGSISGVVQGCTISGMITPGVNNQFVGSILVAGCSEPRLNGNYQVAVHLEGGGTIEVELEREVTLDGVPIKVSIEGELTRSAPPPAPPAPVPSVPPVAGIAIAGNFAGNASFLATHRVSSGRDVTDVDKTAAISLTISSTGSVTGASAGCSFNGSLASNAAVPGTFAGNIVAAGCADAVINGKFAALAGREDADGLELELEREVESNGERINVKIKARLNKQ